MAIDPRKKYRDLDGRLYDVKPIDGPADPNAVYFVLRLDKSFKDRVWTEWCRAAVRGLAGLCMLKRHHEQLGQDLIRYVTELEERV